MSCVGQCQVVQTVRMVAAAQGGLTACTDSTSTAAISFTTGTLGGDTGWSTNTPAATGAATGHGVAGTLAPPSDTCQVSLQHKPCLLWLLAHGGSFCWCGDGSESCKSGLFWGLFWRLGCHYTRLLLMVATCTQRAPQPKGQQGSTARVCKGCHCTKAHPVRSSRTCSSKHSSPPSFERRQTNQKFDERLLTLLNFGPYER